MALPLRHLLRRGAAIAQAFAENRDRRPRQMEKLQGALKY
jgi:hypothetical protein